MYDGNELISSTLVEREAESENILRPQTLEGYIGQDKVKENLMVYISAARRRNENLDHVLLYGPVEITVLTGDVHACNTFDNPENIVPEHMTDDWNGVERIVKLPAASVVTVICHVRK